MANVEKPKQVMPRRGGAGGQARAGVPRRGKAAGGERRPGGRGGRRAAAARPETRYLASVRRTERVLPARMARGGGPAGPGPRGGGRVLDRGRGVRGSGWGAPPSGRAPSPAGLARRTALHARLPVTPRSAGVSWGPCQGDEPWGAARRSALHQPPGPAATAEPGAGATVPRGAPSCERTARDMPRAAPRAAPESRHEAVAVPEPKEGGTGVPAAMGWGGRARGVGRRRPLRRPTKEGAPAPAGASWGRAAAPRGGCCGGGRARRRAAAAPGGAPRGGRAGLKAPGRPRPRVMLSDRVPPIGRHAPSPFSPPSSTATPQICSASLARPAPILRPHCGR
jgi:hypothetical protein